MPLRLGPGIPMDGDNLSVFIDKADVEGNIGILHPERARLRTFVYEQHPRRIGKRPSIHEPPHPSRPVPDDLDIDLLEDLICFVIQKDQFPFLAE